MTCMPLMVPKSPPFAVVWIDRAPPGEEGIGEGGREGEEAG
jgi:hypothetical protein